MVVLLLLLAFTRGLWAQTRFPNGDYWSLDAGFGMTDILVNGKSGQFILDPKLWLSPALMVGSKIGVNYSTDKILTFEGQAYLRWNFLHLGVPDKTTNLFIQGGMGMLSAYRGTTSPVSDVTQTRGSLLFDAAAGVTIPLAPRWQMESSIRGGYPHIAGFSLTAGYKFPLPQKTAYGQLPAVSEYRDTITTLPPRMIIERIRIVAVEFILFGPDIGRYNTGIDRDAQGLNELVINHTAQMLGENRDLQVRIEGHANPVTTDPDEAEELMNLSMMRAKTVAEQLKAKGVGDDRIVITAFGGTRTLTDSQDIWNRNRRVELILMNVETN